MLGIHTYQTLAPFSVPASSNIPVRQFVPHVMVGVGIGILEAVVLH